MTLQTKIEERWVFIGNQRGGPTVWLHMTSRGYRMGSWRECPEAQWPCAWVEVC